MVQNIQSALGAWNGKLAELWSLLTQSPETFKGGDIWNIINTLAGAMQGIGYGLLVLFFAMGVFQSAAGFKEMQRPEFALRHFIRFAGARKTGSRPLRYQIPPCGGIRKSYGKSHKSGETGRF